MVAAASLAFLLNLVLLRSADDRVTVTVAARALEAGQPLQRTDLTTTGLLAEDGALRTLVPADEVGRLVGQVLAHPLDAGELLTRSALRQPASREGLRSMSLPIDPAHAVGGDLRPGDRVDVIEVVDGRPRYVATGLEVLTVSDSGSGTAIGALSSPYLVVVTDDETALRLAAAIRTEAIEIIRSTGADPPTLVELPESTEAPGGG